MNLEPADFTQNSFLTAMESECYDDKITGIFATSHNKSMILSILFPNIQVNFLSF